ncbi:glycerol-3-phosphate 1-O-acyltransferase PlsB [Neptunomonas antarctica]|uniref:Glycerol-3-phosphate acyltransferase n=1 Tax=Neptunomonas antarctica TaxID=619304 RepID=A0A1N7MV86_9GAMM|nr:glycerol-3-phosphate 1-O-acyltransferase PlsB [Neptunomonas antarctica]SIS89861.1 glycerol-3-phosphate acyltransferase [Neptunomonas antarctica]
MRGLNRISRLILRLLVRPTIQGRQHLKPSHNTLFVIETARYTDRLLLIEHLRLQGNTLPEQKILCAAHNQNEDLRNRIEAQIDKLGFLDADNDINIVPISIYYGRLPQRETSCLNLLYAKIWSKAGPFGRFMQLLLNGRQTLIQVDAPLSLRHLKKDSSHQPAGVIAHKAVRVFHNHFYRRRQAIMGPDLSHRRTLIKLILQDAHVKEAINLTATKNSHSTEQVLAEANTLLEEIAADFSPTTVRILAPLLSFFWKKAYKSVHIVGIERVQNCAPDHHLVYLPCHRSHIDYVMLSWSLYQHGLMIPHIAAGDNLNVPILGSILKRGGAIFMRRSFKNDLLYAQLFKSYLFFMANRGHSLEYFIEGGRSRTGRLLPAKTGLLSMTLENHLQHPEKPVALIPVWISYDKLIESKSYQQELSGGLKRKESFLGLLKTLKQFRHRFGDAALSFGEPILLKTALQETPYNISLHASQPISKDMSDNLSEKEPQQEIAAKPTLHDMTQHISQQVLQGINQSAYVNQTALLATLMLANPKQIFNTTELANQTKDLASLLKALPNPPAAIATGAVDEWVTEALKRKQLSQSGNDIFLSEMQAQEMTFYRNQLHHITLLPGLYLLLTKRYSRPLPQTLPRLLSTIYPYLKAELFLPWSGAEVTSACKQIRLRLEKRGMITRNGGLMCVTETPLTIALMRTAEPILLRYYIVFRLLSDGTAMSMDDLISESQRIAVHLHHHFGFNSPEYSDERVLTVFIKALISRSVFAKQADQVSCRIESSALLKRARQILNPHYISVVEKALHPR